VSTRLAAVADFELPTWKTVGATGVAAGVDFENTNLSFFLFFKATFFFIVSTHTSKSYQISFILFSKKYNNTSITMIRLFLLIATLVSLAPAAWSRKIRGFGEQDGLPFEADQLQRMLHPTPSMGPPSVAAAPHDMSSHSCEDIPACNALGLKGGKKIYQTCRVFPSMVHYSKTRKSCVHLVVLFSLPCFLGPPVRSLL
jgi:hypothetical protein